MIGFPLHRQECKWYALPDLHATSLGVPIGVLVDGWEASFDRGLTWHQSAAHPDDAQVPAWRVRGPSYPGPGDTSSAEAALVAKSGPPLIRMRDHPETVIGGAPHITLWY